MGKTETIGLLFATIAVFNFADVVGEWISNLPLPYWVKCILSLFAIVLWFNSIAFLYFAEKAMRNRKKDDYE